VGVKEGDSASEKSSVMEGVGMAQEAILRHCKVIHIYLIVPLDSQNI